MIFRLEEFPDVCRLCLKAPFSLPSHRVVMIPLTATDPILDGSSIGDFITAITFEISEDKRDFLPKAICLPCLELLRFFAKYRSKITTVHLLMNSLAELKLSNLVPLMDLFQNKSDNVRMVIKDLDLCTVNDYCVEDLLNEFYQYKYSESSVKQLERHVQGKEVTTSDLLENVKIIYAEECSPEEIIELTKDIPSVLKEDSSDDCTAFNANKPQTQAKDGSITLEPPFSCPKCKFKTYFERNFKTHQQKHVKLENRRYPCKEPACTEVLRTRRLRNLHMSSTHKSFVCEICGFRSASKAVLDVHMARHLKKYEYVCIYCQKPHNTKCDLSSHIKFAHSDESNFSCPICGLIFRRKPILTEHLLSHSDKLNVACKFCDKKFKRKRNLLKHIRAVHEKVRLPCDYCPNDYGTRYHLKEHIESVHGIQTRFVCDVCIQVFDTQEKLDSHKTRHAEPKELECGICLVVFPSDDRFKNHLCISYRDDYICCGRDLRYHYFYNKHMLIKHGIRTNARVKPTPGLLVGQMRAKRKRIEICPKCDKIFATRTQKKNHLETCADDEEVVVDQTMS